MADQPVATREARGIAGELAMALIEGERGRLWQGWPCPTCGRLPTQKDPSHTEPCPLGRLLTMADKNPRTLQVLDELEAEARRDLPDEEGKPT